MNYTNHTNHTPHIIENDMKSIEIVITEGNRSKNLFYEFREMIRKNPYEIHNEINNPKYEYIAKMFPQEYIKGLRIYIDKLNFELKNLETIFKIRSRL